MSISERSWLRWLVVAAGLVALHAVSCGPGSEADTWAGIEPQFRELPMESRRLTGPLFWLHGDESQERLESYLEKVVEGGNGCFTAESRPHKDWLGPGWYRDLGICLEMARKLDLKMWIFDEEWWPSGEVGGKVPPEHGSKYMEATSTDVVGPGRFTQDVSTDKLIKVLAGRQTDGGIDGESLIDLTGLISDGALGWDVPDGTWNVMTFSWRYSEGRHGRLLVDGASRSAVDWYVRTVYQPHYDHFGDAFGKTIAGYFYDEPETLGDWGTEVIPMLQERGLDWKKALVSWKFTLAGEEQVAARYQYQDAYAEAWGRTFYGRLTEWCRDHKVLSIGHFLEHNWEYLDPRLCAGNMFQLQKYSDMGAIDLVCQQFYPGSKDPKFFQMAKLGSSISHVYGKVDDLAMCEIFGAYGQEITYPEMKWLTDQMQVRGINFMIPHAFNPRSPYDRDCPPYFYNSGYEPRWPLYRVYADYTTRLSLMLSGGRHICPVAFLYLGNSKHVGESIVPEDMTTVLQDALFDCDWMPYDVFEADTRIDGGELLLHKERYRVLIVPAVEVIPYAVMAKARAFFDAGGVVVGYGMLPSKSATLDKSADDVALLRRAVWGDVTEPGLDVCKRNDAGGRSYYLPAKVTSGQIQQVLTGDAGIHPTLEVLEGQTNDWLHVLHRVKAGRDVFLVCNQNHEGQVRALRLRLRARGVPECWDAMRNEITAVAFDRVDADTVDVALELEPMESVLLVFQPVAIERPVRIESATKAARPSIAVMRIPTPPEKVIPSAPPTERKKELALDTCQWVWCGEDENYMTAPRGVRYFRKRVDIPCDATIRGAKMRAAADNSFVLYVNGREAGRGSGWMSAPVIDLAGLLVGGTNVLGVTATNGGHGPNPAGLIGCYEIVFDDGTVIAGRIDKTWGSIGRELPEWDTAGFDDTRWPAAKEWAAFGAAPWGRQAGAEVLTPSPIQANPFCGQFDLPTDVDLSRYRVFLEMNDMERPAASVTLNGHQAGGVIGAPLRVNISRWVRPGQNALTIEPYAPGSANIAFYERK